MRIRSPRAEYKLLLFGDPWCKDIRIPSKIFKVIVSTLWCIYIYIYIRIYTYHDFTVKRGSSDAQPREAS